MSYYTTTPININDEPQSFAVVSTGYQSSYSCSIVFRPSETTHITLSQPINGLIIGVTYELSYSDEVSTGNPSSI